MLSIKQINALRNGDTVQTDAKHTSLIGTVIAKTRQHVQFEWQGIAYDKDGKEIGIGKYKQWISKTDKAWLSFTRI